MWRTFPTCVVVAHLGNVRPIRQVTSLTRRSSMKTAIVIPARFASSRLPGKPLLHATGKYLVQHVYENACRCRADDVIVATDDDRIVAAVRSFGGRAMLTRTDHPSGTDRVAEVACN